MSSTNTPNLNLFKAAPGTNEPFRTSDVNSNWDKVDAAIGAPYSDVTQASLGNSTTETQLMVQAIGGPAAAGSVWKFEACGTFGHAASSTTLTFRVKLGGTAVTWTITTPASALSGRIWRIDCTVYCLTTGGSGTFRISALGVATVNATDTPVLMSGNVTKDTTVAQNLEITAQWGAASASNVVTCDAGYIKRVTNA